MTFPAILADNIASVRQAIVLLGKIDSTAYTNRHATFFDATIGGHIRHNIDHYLNFFRGLPTGRIDYESRERDLATECDHTHATKILEHIAIQLESLAPHKTTYRYYDPPSTTVPHRTTIIR